MNPFSVVSYCQQNLSSLPSLPSGLLQRRTSSHVVNVVVQTSGSVTGGGASSGHKKQQQQDQQQKHSSAQSQAHTPLPPHTPASYTPPIQPTRIEGDRDDANTPIKAVIIKSRSNPQAILPETDNKALDSNFARVDSSASTESFATPEKEEEESILSLREKKALRRHSSFPLMQVSKLIQDDEVSIPKRASFDSFERSKILSSMSVDGIETTTMVSQPRSLHLRHARAFSSPSLLRLSSPAIPVVKPSSPGISAPLPNIPAVRPTVDHDEIDQYESVDDRDQGEHDDNESEHDEEEDDQEQEQEQEKSTDDIREEAADTKPVSVSLLQPQVVSLSTETIQSLEVTESSIPPISLSSNSFSSPSPPHTQQESVKASDPTPSPPALVAPIATPVVADTPSMTSPSGSVPVSPPRRSTAAAAVSAASTATSFLASWQGRSRAMIPSIPRPSPLMPFRAARSVVHQVTAAGTGMIPSKEQLGALPVAGRLMKHPVMDSTLDYIATMANERGISLEMSKAIDDEAGDDAFELYLAAINTLLHALPFETCDPLRREAFESQLRTFLVEEFENGQESDQQSDADSATKRLRRDRRRRHRHHHTQATTLIQHHTMAIPPTQSPQQKPTKAQQSQKSTKQSQQQQQPSESKKASKQPQQRQSQSKESRKKHENSSRHQHQQQSTRTVEKSDSKHSRKHGRSRRRSSPKEDRYDGNTSTNGSGTGIGEAIISTAVTSAIRLKQSPIPDMVKSCLRTSGRILHHVDERFHLQDRAWELSKQSIEKAIELDEQYAIHEVVTETVFATLTGLVKAGIAYKETPSHSAVRAAIAGESAVDTVPSPSLSPVSAGQRPNHPQTVPKEQKSKSCKFSKKSSRNTKDIPEVIPKTSAGRRLTLLSIRDHYWGRNAVVAEESPVVAPSSKSKSSRSRGDRHRQSRHIVESSSESEEDSDESFSSTDSEDSEDDSSSSSSTCASDSEDENDSRSDNSENEDEEYEHDIRQRSQQQRQQEPRASVELNEDTLRSIPRYGYAGAGRLPPAKKGPSATPYTDQVREKIGMFMALKGAASLVVGNLSSQ
ncbi:hypothetical protein BGZ83_008517 [Gryganskiella cystojenkinii]|nr:hypothetical protein BGZ83_008517 [Gryganskiella cystojenkinii]